MRGTMMKLLRKWAKSSGADFSSTKEWWESLPRPQREKASAEMRRRLVPKAGAAAGGA